MLIRKVLSALLLSFMARGETLTLEDFRAACRSKNYGAQQCNCVVANLVESAKDQKELKFLIKVYKSSGLIETSPQESMLIEFHEGIFKQCLKDPEWRK